VQNYFGANPQEEAELEGIRQPLTDIRERCQWTPLLGQGAAIRNQPRSWITGDSRDRGVASSCVVQPAGVADTDVCASVGRRVSVSGCN
jgi:Haemophore, haem-binding